MQYRVELTVTLEIEAEQPQATETITLVAREAVTNALQAAYQDGFNHCLDHEEISISLANIQVDLVNEPLIKHVQVEYDLTFYGGDYNQVGQFAYIPLNEIGDEPNAVEEAFEKLTGHSRQHIIHYSPDELYTSEGEPIDA